MKSPLAMFVIMAVIMTFSLAACNKDTSNKDVKKSSNSSNQNSGDEVRY